MPAHFGPELFGFLRDLARNNDRAWFATHKADYERHVRDPFLRFVADAAAPLSAISAQVTADPRPMGGSLFRIHRDTRFSKDKTPYKTHAAAHFRHRAGKDVHAPGFYLGLGPGEVHVGAGLWHPDPPALLRVRQALVRDGAGWKKLTGAAAFRAAGEMAGESAKRAPAGLRSRASADRGHPAQGLHRPRHLEGGGGPRPGLPGPLPALLQDDRAARRLPRPRARPRVVSVRVRRSGASRPGGPWCGA